MSPAPDSQQQAIDYLTQKITGLQVVFQELTHFYNTSPDLQFRSSLRPDLFETNQDIFFLESLRDSAVARTQVVTPPTPQEIQDVQEGLKQLDRYVRSDQNFQMCVSYLQQVAAQLKG